MTNEPSFTSVLDGYRRVALTVAAIVVGVALLRALIYFDLVPDHVAALLPYLAIFGGGVLFVVLYRGHRALSLSLDGVASHMQAAKAQIHQDALTGVFSRSYFLEALSSHVYHGASQSVGYMHLDMDNLKVLNDSAGHAAGDAALVHLARIIRKVAPSALVGRLGGDEFGIMIVGHDNKAALRRLGEELLRQLDRPIAIGGRPTRLSASIGVALSPRDAVDATDLISKADLALYRGKKTGRHAVVCFDPDMLGDERHRRFVERELRAALLMDELEVYYQPVLNAELVIRSHEALVRWRHQVRGTISPAQFIPIAEESDLIDRLGDWVLRRTCLDVQALGTPVAVNISPVQLRHADFAQRFLAVLEEMGTDPAEIIVEITETVPLYARAVELKNLETLRAKGVRVAIDDFGAGHASLQYLRGFAFDIIKIDRSYVANLAESRMDRMIVGAICDIARSLPVDVIAEGIETEEQLALLRDAGCTGFQGYLLGRPKPIGKPLANPTVTIAA